MKRIIHMLLLVATLPLTSLHAGERITPLPSGTLLFLQNGNKIVRGLTNSGFSHVAILMREGEQPWVYEATPAKVRRMRLDDYYQEIARLNSVRKAKHHIRVWLLTPRRHYKEEAVTRMKTYLDEQVGRRYSVKGIVRGKKGDGIHCSQLASQTLRRTAKLDFSDCHLITPGALIAHVTSYYPSRCEAELPVHVDNRKWCQKSWDHVAGYFAWCSWSCQESWSWLR